MQRTRAGHVRLDDRQHRSDRDCRVDCVAAGVEDDLTRPTASCLGAATAPSDWSTMDGRRQAVRGWAPSWRCAIRAGRSFGEGVRWLVLASWPARSRS